MYLYPHRRLSRLNTDNLIVDTTEGCEPAQRIVPVSCEAEGHFAERLFDRWLALKLIRALARAIHLTLHGALAPLRNQFHH